MSKTVIIIVIIVILLLLAILYLRKKTTWTNSDIDRCKDMLADQFSDLGCDSKVYNQLVNNIKNSYSFSQFENEIDDPKFPDTFFGKYLIESINKYNLDLGRSSKWTPFMEMLMLTCICKIPSYKNIDLNSGKILVDGIKTKFNFITEWLHYLMKKSLSPNLNTYVINFTRDTKFNGTPFITLLSN